MRTILATGGAGYVGAHCCKAFARAGWRVVVFDNLSRGWRDFVCWGDLIEGDVCDSEALQKAIAHVKPDIVAHFAALAYVSESIEQPGAYYRTNVVGALHLLEAMRNTGVNRLVFSSSCATYGEARTTPIDETHPQQPINPYGWSKLLVERMLADYSLAYGLNYASLRYFNAAGADPDGEVGERHEPEMHVIPLAIRGALQDDYVFTILGDGYPTRDGTALRDYVHVTDLADAHARAADYLMSGGESAAFNLGTGVGTTVLEIADAVERVAGRAIQRRIGPARIGDPPALVARADKARSMLGWHPAMSEIDSIITTAWRWHLRERD